MVEIKKYKAEDAKVKMLVYGKSGAGKTVFGSTAPKVLFISAENGLMSVADKGIDFIKVTTLAELQEVYKLLKENDDIVAGFDSIVIDSITEINERIKENIEKTNKRSMQLKDWGELSSTIRKLLRAFSELDKHVVFIAQEKVERDEDSIYSIVPNLNGKNALEAAYFMDMVGYLGINKEGNRVLYTESDGKTVAKDRTGNIGNMENPDFTDIIKLIGKKKPEKKVEKKK